MSEIALYEKEPHPFANPYARLVNAVQHDSPQFRATDVPDLVHLAQNCLVKFPDTRFQLVTWNDFLSTPPHLSPGLLARQRVAQARHRATPAPTAAPDHQLRWQAVHQHTQLAHAIEMWLRQWCVTQDLLPPVEISTTVAPTPMISTFSLHFRPDAPRGLHHHLLIHVEVRILDLAISAIELLADAALVASPRFPEARQLVSLHRGIATEDTLRPVFETAVYPAFDLATRDSAQSGRLNIEPFFAPGED